MSDLVVSQAPSLTQQPQMATNLRIENVDDLSRIAKMMAVSGFFSDCRDAAQAGVKILAGLELGFPAFASLVGIQIIKGRPVMGANLMAAAIKKSLKYDYKVVKHTSDSCSIEFFERTAQGWGSIGFSEFSIAEATAAGLNSGDNWKKYPRNMLFARAISNGVRWHCPDLFLGASVYTPDEFGVSVDEDGDIPSRINEPEPVPQKISKQAITSLWEEAQSLGWTKESLRGLLMDEFGVSKAADLLEASVDDFRALIADQGVQSSHLSQALNQA